MSSLPRIAGIGVAAALLAAGSWWVLNADETPAQATTSTRPTDLATAQVTRRTLEHREEFNGALGYGDQFPLPGQAVGTVSWVPAKGTLLQPDDLLYRVNEQPTYWARGEVPMYRELASGSEGADVEQLQRHLQAEGYLSAEAELDGDFGSSTRNALKAWQGDHGLKKTGRIDATQLVFLPYETLRVAATPRVGEPAAGGVLEVTEPNLFATVDVSARKKRAFEGQPDIEVETADGTRYSAEVASIDAQQSQDAFGGQNYRVRLQLEGGAGLEPGEASIEAVDTLAENALTVPASALVALTEGGYALEVVGADGATAYRAVGIGEFADGWVQVTGDIAEGETVVVPQ